MLLLISDSEIASKYHAQKETDENASIRNMKENKKENDTDNINNNNNNNNINKEDHGNARNNKDNTRINSLKAIKSIFQQIRSYQRQNRDKKLAENNTESKTEEDTADDDDDLDKETSDLLNINVSPDGKIHQSDKIEKFTKESIFNKENLLPYLKTPKRNITSELFISNKSITLSNHPMETNKLMDDIAILKNDLKSSLVISNKIINEKLNGYGYDQYNYNRKKSLISFGRIMNKTVPQALLLDTFSPVKRTEINRYKTPIETPSIHNFHPLPKINISLAEHNNKKIQRNSNATKKATFSQIKDRKINSRVKFISKSVLIEQEKLKEKEKKDILLKMYRKPSHHQSSNKRHMSYSKEKSVLSQQSCK